MQQYDFSDALRLMKEGKTLLVNGATYTLVKDKRGEFLFQTYNGKRFDLITRLHVEDILATDWIIYES